MPKKKKKNSLSTPKKKKRSGKIIADQRYNKTSFGEKWSSITKKSPRELSEDDIYFIREALIESERFAELGKNEETLIKITQATFQKYPVKGIMLISPNSKSEIWIGKKTITDLIFPPQKTKKHINWKTKLSLAFRQIVEEDMAIERNIQRKRAYMDESFCCPLSGIPLKDCPSGTHLDHVYPFSRMVDDFLRRFNIEGEWVEVVHRGTSYSLKDTEIVKKWLQYHRENADLKLTCAKYNIQKSNKY